jgi:hypothetical protein
MYERCIRGEIISDFYCNKEELNFATEDKDAVIYGEKLLNYKNKVMKGQNGFCINHKLFAFNVDINVKWISFKGRLIKIAKMRLDGVCGVYTTHDGKFISGLQGCEGNKVLKCYQNKAVLEKFRTHFAEVVQQQFNADKREPWFMEVGYPMLISENYADFIENASKNFKDNVIECICYKPINYFDNLEQLNADMNKSNLNKRETMRILDDVFG